MNSSNFYVPRLAKLTGHELAFAKQDINLEYRMHAEFDVPELDFAVPVTAHPINLSHAITTRRVGLEYRSGPEDWEPEFFAMGPFQITYNFSSAVRKNNFPVRSALPFSPKIYKEYGAAGWSFRMLYEFLCEAYNGGTPFIDSYFQSVFKTRSVYQDFKTIYTTIQDDINNEQYDLFMGLPLKSDGTPDMRYTSSKKFADFKVWQNPIIQRDCKALAKDIRGDIVTCLSTGRIPLAKQRVSRPWQERRAELDGMHPNQFFYASGQLINHLNIYVKVGRVV